MSAASRTSKTAAPRASSPACSRAGPSSCSATNTAAAAAPPVSAALMLSAGGAPLPPPPASSRRRRRRRSHVSQSSLARSCAARQRTSCTAICKPRTDMLAGWVAHPGTGRAGASDPLVEPLHGARAAASAERPIDAPSATAASARRPPPMQRALALCLLGPGGPGLLQDRPRRR